MGSLFLELSKQENLLKMMEEKGFTLCQQNGQRTYGGPPPGWGTRPPPNRDCEVFIGRLPRMCYEDELIPLFASVGELYEFRLMLDFSGTNRGYAYAHYTTTEGAARAIKYLNKYEIRPGHLIGVLKSKNNCRLLFGNIKSAIKVNNFTEFIRNATDQVLNVIMFDNFNELKSTQYRISSEVEEAFLGRVPKQDGKFAIVEYENHKAAAVARRILIPKYGHILAIDWAVPPRDKKRTTIEPEKVSISQESTSFPCVPLLVLKPSITTSLFSDTVVFFKHLLQICINSFIVQLELPQQIYSEIELKIIDRITNIESCGEGVNLIMNYFTWWTEQKRRQVNPEVQLLLHEIKLYSNFFLQYIWKKTLSGGQDNPEMDNFFCNILPRKLAFLHQIITIYNGQNPFRFVMRISKGLAWLDSLIENESKATLDLASELMQYLQKHSK
ncbi:hypothetical protein RUM43_004627 [Polyplax serrata]|uniref:RRM domain-containing protein n=1 Tax=Polyplax serrata TaxID=468196 RepID=A0AAN8SBZ1_POLSC